MKNSFRIFLAWSFCLLCSQAYGQWRPTNGPIGLAVNHFAIKDSILFAETNLGIYESKNHGMNWEAMPPDHGYGRRSGMVVNQGCLFVGSQAGLFRYDESMKKWSLANATIADTTVGSMATFGNKLIVSNFSGEIFSSIDQGLHWVKIFSNPTETSILALALDSNAIYARTTDKVIHSLDNGAHWISSTANFLEEGIFSFLVVSAEYVFTQSGSSILRSSDFGVTWKTVFPGKDSMALTCLSQAGGFLFASLQGNVNPISTYRSADHGETWVDISPFFTLDQGLQVYQMEKLGGDLFAATFHGVFRSQDNGVNWSQMGKGISSISFKSVLNWPNGDLIGLSNWGMFQSHDLGENWIRIADTTEFGVHHRFNFLHAKDGQIFATMDEPGLYRSTDEGLNWSLVNDLVSPMYAKNIASLGPDLFSFSGAEEVRRSHDEGKTWTSASKGLPAHQDGALAVCDGTLFFTNYIGLYSYQPILNAWEILPEIPLSRFIDFFSDGMTLYLNNGMHQSYHSVDKGLTWLAMKDGLDSSNIRCALAKDDFVFAGTSFNWDRFTNLVVSKNRGATWSSINTGLPEEDVNSLFIQGEYLFAVTGRGVWKRPIKELEVISANTKGMRRPIPFHRALGRHERGRIEWNFHSKSMAESARFDCRGRR